MSATVYMRFYAELNDFISPEKRQVPFSHSFFGQPPVKDLIESLGVPHTEVDLILVGGNSAGFYHRVKDGDMISVYPVFETFDISQILKVRPKPLRQTGFVLDVHLGKLAGFLRMLGFDLLYQNDYNDNILAEISAGEHRILLTRDRGLLKRSAVTHGYLVRSNNPREQLREVLHRFDLYNSIEPFRRCMRCNGLLEPVSVEEVRGKVPPRVFERISEYNRCPVCHRIYWKGSHYKKMAGFIKTCFPDNC